MNESFVPRQGRKQCPACGKGVGARSKVCKYCSHKFSVRDPESKPKLELKQLQAVADFVAACGGFVQARLALHESKVFLDRMSEFNQKYLKGKRDDDVESAVDSGSDGVVGSGDRCGVR